MIQMMRVLAEVLDRAGLSRMAGVTFGGARDLYAALGYERELTTKHYRQRYERGDISGRIVDAYPKATWREGAELIEDENPLVLTAFEEAWTALANRLQVWSVFTRADILAGLGRYAVILLGVPGELEAPAPGQLGPDQLMYLQPFGEEECKVQDLEEDAKNPRFGKPRIYNLDRKTVVGRSKTRLVHYSRVLHIADGVLDDPMAGEPRLRRPWNRLDDIDKVAGGGSEAFWQRVHQGLFFNVDPTTKLGDTVAEERTALEAMRTKAEEWANGMKRTMAMRGAEVTALGSDVSNFESQLRSLISLISGATGIPQRILLGSERGELASTQDKENWDQRVADRRTSYAEPAVVRPFVVRLIELGVLPKPVKFDVRWPEMDDLTPLEQADVADKLSKLNAQSGGTVITPAEIRDRILHMDPVVEPNGQPTTVALGLPTTPAVPALPPAPALAARGAAASAPAPKGAVRGFGKPSLPQLREPSPELRES